MLIEDENIGASLEWAEGLTLITDDSRPEEHNTQFNIL